MRSSLPLNLALDQALDFLADFNLSETWPHPLCKIKSEANVMALERWISYNIKSHIVSHLGNTNLCPYIFVLFVLYSCSIVPLLPEVIGLINVIDAET